MRILVTGATGYVGSRLVTALVADGHRVLTATRDPARLERMGWSDDVTPVSLDASDAESVRGAFDAAGRVRSTRWRTHTTLPTAIRRGPAAMRCGCDDSRAG